MCCVTAVFVNIFDWSVSATETLSEIGCYSYLFFLKALLITEQFCNQYSLFFLIGSSSIKFHSFTCEVKFFDFLAEQQWESRRCLTT